MQKFYVQSGDVQWLLMARDPSDAALKFVQRVMTGAHVKGKQPTSSYRMVDRAVARKLVTALNGKIVVRQQGFSSPEIASFPTNDFLLKWQKQIENLEKLIRKST